MPHEPTASEETRVETDPDQAVKAVEASQDGRPSTARQGGLYRWIRGKKAAGSRISTGSSLYTRVLPVVILVMGLLTAALILFAAGVLLGIVPFR